MPRRPTAPPAPAPRLVLEAGPTSGPRVVPLRRDVVVGRDPGCDVVLDDPQVGARHARLRVDEGTVILVDLGSEKGTTVNGRAVPPEGVPVVGGDRIGFGPVAARIDDPWHRTAARAPAMPPPGEASRPRAVFVSYARADAPLVRPIAQRLEAAGHVISDDTDDLAAGSTRTQRVIEAIEHSDALVVVLTSRSVSSPEVGREVHVAAAKRVPIIPVAVAPVRVPGHLEYPLSGIPRIEVPRGDTQAVADQVLEAVDRGLSGRRRTGVPRRVVDVLGVVLLVLGLGLGVATAVTGALPPWAGQARCGAVVLEAEPGRPASTGSEPGAELLFRLVNESDRTVRVLGAVDVQVEAQDGFAYDVEPLPASGSWLHGFAVGPRATVERRLVVAAPPSRGPSDQVSVEIASIVEGPLPLLRCRAVVDGVTLQIAG